MTNLYKTQARKLVEEMAIRNELSEFKEYLWDEWHLHDELCRHYQRQGLSGSEPLSRRELVTEILNAFQEKFKDMLT